MHVGEVLWRGAEELPVVLLHQVHKHDNHLQKRMLHGTVND